MKFYGEPMFHHFMDMNYYSDNDVLNEKVSVSTSFVD